MKRRLFIPAAVVSLLLCVATLALWVRSYWRYDYVGRFSRRDLHFWQITSVRGSIDLVRLVNISPLEGEAALRRIVPKLYFGSMDLSNYPGRAPADVTFLSVPHWVLVLLFAILPALQLGSTIRSRRRHRAGACLRCGYDLRATPARCPECGAVPAVK